MRRYILTIILGFGYLFLSGSLPVAGQGVFTYKTDVIRIASFWVLEDKSGTLTVDSVIHATFGPLADKVDGSNGTINWLKVEVKNLSEEDSLFIELRNPSLEDVWFYQYANGSVQNTLSLGLNRSFSERPIPVPDYVFPFAIKRGTSATIFIRIKSHTQGYLPLYIGKPSFLLEESLGNSIFIGIYVGIICIMFFYNLFLYFTVDDRSYLYYILYIFAVGLAQLVLNGFAFKYLWPDNIWLSIHAYNLSGIFSGIATAFFVQSFLGTKRVTPKLHQVFNLMIFTYFVALGFTLFIDRSIAFNIINGVAGIGSVFAICTAFFIARKGYREAYFFLLAFSVFLVAVIIHILRTSNILPYNNFTANILEAGSAIQILLLSFALADKINTYRKEQAQAKQEALAASLENERLIKDQNIILEKQVHERTLELEAANTNLNQTLSQLKDAQSKLVESEKMVSLGQLTAGIAHEINNPINFVTSNVKPLELDITDIQSLVKKYEEIDPSKDIQEQLSAINSYRQQIDLDYINEEIRTLLTGIRDGAHRTAEIVSNLKNFARIDEANVKFANLNEGLHSTLMLVKNSFPKDFVLNKEFGNIPDVECTPGKINQVFMNIITNGLQSIAERQAVSPGTGILTIKTSEENGHVKVSIKDNGTGIKESAHEKIFEPFYTTKPVGQGTGLGMSIVKGIIDSHNGTIEVISNFGEGAEFIITLPVNYLA